MNCTRKPVPMKDVLRCVDGVMSFNPPAFVTYFKEFAQVDALALQLEGDTSVSMLSLCAFGRMYGLAVSLMTAHRLALYYDLSDVYESEGLQDQSTTEIGTNLSASTSSLSEGATPLGLINGDDPFTVDLAKTRYGLRLLALIATWISPVDIVTGTQIGKPYGAMQWPPPDSGY